MDIMKYISYAAALLLWSVTLSNGDCIYDPGLEAYTHKGGSIENGRQVIVPHLNFSCYGRITHITYVTINGSHPGNKLPVFQIWRPSSFGSNVYNRVGQAQFRSESLIIIEDTVIEDTKFYLTNAEMMVENHQIEFQPGDVIGYYQPSNAHRLIWSIEETNEYVSYSNNASEAFTTFNRSNVDHVDNNLLPFITVGFDIKCDNLSAPSNGRITSCSSGTTGVGYEGDTCSFTCNTDYELTGSDTRTCQSDGNWNGTVTICSGTVCPRLDNPANGKRDCPLGDNEVAYYKDICSFSCNTGYELTGDVTRTCQSDGNWSGSEATCRKVCPRLHNPANGKHDCLFGDNEVAYYRDSCNFSCNTGYELTGDVTRTCQGDGNWSGSEATCRKASCPKLNNPDNGMIKCQSKEIKEYLYEDTCSFTCNTGYELTGSDIRTCQSDGSWSGSESTCEKETSSNEVTSQNNNGRDSGSGSSGAAIGGAIGGVLVTIVIIILVLVIILCYTRRVKKRKDHPAPGRVLPNGFNAVHNPLYGEYITTGLSRSDYEDPDSPDYSATGATSKTVQYELPTSSVDKAATPSPPSMTMRSQQNVYTTTPYKDEGNYDSLYCEPSSDEQKIYEHFEGKMFRKLHHSEIRSFEELGMGEFGVVTRCMWKQSTDRELEVAVKTLNLNASDKDRLRFLQEAAIMCQFDHPNVIKLHGVVTEAPIMIVLEYMSHGNLRKFLMQMRHTNSATAYERMPLTLLKFCNEIAAGMVYLSGKQFVHRDLAARNILISENFTCKIADFGMSRDLIDHNYYITSGGKIPVKWTAPEALHYKKYSVQSDVWSYGCVLYEIWSLGHKPFEELTNTEALEKVDRGYRLPPPPGCSRIIYQLMINCWNPDAKLRPQFGHIAQVLTGDSQCLLGWSDEDKQIGGENAMKLGAPLENGNNLYYDLQMQYRQ